VFCVDAGVFLEGFHTDMAETIIIDNNGEWQRAKNQEYAERERFLRIGKKALEAGLAQAQAGNRIGHISKAIQDIVEKEGGYSIIRALIGHGVGRELHEAPEVPGFLDHPIEKTPELEPGMTIAVEVIYNMGGRDVEYRGDDDWTIVSADKSLSAVFERSLAITENGTDILTP
jgi:methionyl aminopeptidase